MCSPTSTPAIPVSQFTLAPALQQGFIDKDTGLELAAGVITFYRDEDHTTLKPIYTVGGPPDSPIFTELPNPLTLSAIGTFQYLGQDIIPYYRPYDDQGNIDLYYITVYNSGGTEQFTRDHYPLIITTTPTPPVEIEQTDNFIPNGQFLAHLNLPSSGAIVDPITPIAYGKWSFEADSGFTSTNFVTFDRFNAPISIPDANPRYAVRVVCTDPEPAELRKDLCNTITDVNFMQNQQGTLAFWATSNAGIPAAVDVIIRKNFGTGGSPTTETILANLSILPTEEQYTIPFVMPDNTGKTLGAGDDDYLQIIIRPDTGSTCNLSFTDFIYVFGAPTTLPYPQVSPEQDAAFTLPASFAIPAYDGSDEGKSVQLKTVTLHGEESLAYVYGYGLVPTGTLLPYPGMTAPGGFVLSDGTSYAVQTGGDLGVLPDLFTLIFSSSTIGTYTFGTGVNGFTYSLTDSPNPPAGPDQTYIYWNRFDIAQPAPNPGTSGFTFVVQQNVVANVQQQIYLMTVLAGSSITAGSYFTLPVNTTGPQFIQMFWFTVDGVGTQPVVTFNSVVKIAILSTDTTTQVRDKIRQFANGLFQVPDMRNNYAQYWNHGSTGWDLGGVPPNQQPANRDPSENYQANSITPLFVSYTTGNSGDNIGSSARGPTPTSSGFGSNSASPFSIYFNAIMKT